MCIWLAACRILVFVSEPSQFLLAFPPVRIYLYIQTKEYLLLEEIFHVYTCLRSDLLEGLSSLADDDALLGITHDIDYSAYVISFSSFLEFFHHYLSAVRYLFLIVEEDLLAYDLRSEESEVLVGKHILVIPCRCIWEIAHDCIEDVVKVELLLC